MRGVARLLVLVGAAGVVVSTFLPWVSVEGTPLALDLGWLGADVSPGGTTVSGTETAAWPVVAGVGALVAVLALLNLARKLLMLFGVLIVLAGGRLLYYAFNLDDIETAVRSAIEQAIAAPVVTS